MVDAIERLVNDGVLTKRTTTAFGSNGAGVSITRLDATLGMAAGGDDITLALNALPAPNVQRCLRLCSMLPD